VEKRQVGDPHVSGCHEVDRTGSTGGICLDDGLKFVAGECLAFQQGNGESVQPGAMLPASRRRAVS